MRVALIIMLVSLFLAGCGEQSASNDGVADAVVQHLTLLVNKDETGFSQTICPAYESEAMREFRSFGAVDASLNDVSCAVDGTEGDTTFVICTGSIDLVYQGEETRPLDLSRVPYRAVQDDGQWKVCGKGREE